MSFDASGITCKHPPAALEEIHAYSTVTTKRYRCKECGFLLYSRRGGRLKFYACEFTEVVVIRTEGDGTEIKKRISTCSTPASHFVGLRGHPRCTKHANPRKTKEQETYMKETERAKKTRKKDLKEFEKRCEEIRKECGTKPLPKSQPQTDEPRHGGVVMF